MLIREYKDIDPLPATLRVYGASDYATMEPQKGKKEPDFTEHGVVGMCPRGDLWFLDWWYGQKETDKSIAQFIRLAGVWKPQRWWNEGGLIDKAIGPAIRDAMRRANRYVAIESLPSVLDKGAKLQSFHARAAAGTVHFPIRAPWAERVIEQLVKFPAGRWDDAADVCGLIGRGLDQMFAPSEPVAQRKPMLVPFTAAWLEHDQFAKPKVRYF